MELNLDLLLLIKILHQLIHHLYFSPHRFILLTYLDKLVAEINTAGIGVTAVDGTTELQLTASSAGTSGNSISVDTGSGIT